MSEDPVEYEVTRKSTEKDGITSEMLDKTEESVISHSVSLDFTHYQEIYGELKKQRELSKLPLSHVIFNLLSLGIMTAHEEEKRRENEKSN